ncbi:MAG: hypothetical protein NZ941_01855, partial [Candidatus Caldarchaeum sp.]|nr:hypothetical protein [Candidatus Caldarchaeum sp.]MDW7978028.1 hypothetical protein [Candidatus Caldarchaeum sp.]
CGERMELDEFQRASLYVSTYVLFSSIAEGKTPPQEVEAFFESMGVDLPQTGAQASEYLRRLKASEVRLDLPATARANLHNHVKVFMAQAGYEAPEPADSATSMAAFAARLAVDAYLASLTGQTRGGQAELKLVKFLQTHLLPTLEKAEVSDENLRHILKTVAELLRTDTNHLTRKLAESIKNGYFHGHVENTNRHQQFC